MGSRGACSGILRGCKGSRGMSRGLQSKKVQEVRGGQGGVQGVKRGEVGLLGDPMGSMCLTGVLMICRLISLYMRSRFFLWADWQSQSST